MKNFQWKSLLPHAIAVAIFLVIAIIYCKPALEGKVLSQSDVVSWKGMAQDMQNYKDKHGHWPLWNNNLFGGMPGYQITLGADNPLSPIFMHTIFTLNLPKPIGFFFLLCIGFYFLSQVVGTRSWIGVLGALAFAYSTYDPVLIATGHDTKLLALAYMAPLMGALWLVYQRKYWWGGALTALFSCLLIGMAHLQITYYFLIVAAFMSVAFIIQWVKTKEYKHMFTALAVAIIAGLVGVGPNLVFLATTTDYADASMRGGTLKSDTTTSIANPSKSKTSLTVDYAFYYGSLSVPETYTFLIPGIYGGSSGGELDGNSHFAKKAIEKGIPEDQAAQFAASVSSYWGPQPLTSGPVYFGAIICFLFIFGMVYLKTWHRWWILAVCLLSVVMSWGSSFMAFNNFLFNYLPLYNKFRAPSIILVIPQLLFPFVAILALQKVLFEETDKMAAIKKFKRALYITGGLLLLAVVLYLSFDYTGKLDDQLKSGITRALGGNQEEGATFFNALREDRKSMFGSDLVRSILLIAAAAAALWLVLKNRIKAMHALIALLLLSSFDLLAVGRRYLNDNNYQEAEAMNEAYFRPSAIDQEILRDPSHPRVFNLAAQSGPFNDALTSYHHRSVGGYHPAKLALYQDLIEFQLSKQLNMHVLNMLNTKYFIVPNQQGGQPVLQVNPGALGYVWFAKHISYVKTPLEVMKAMENFNPKDTAIVEEKFKTAIPFEPGTDSAASIQLIENDNDIIKYKSSSSTNQFAVFSEVYYDRGWQATIDGKAAPIVQTNYILRGLAVPAGNHEIVFEFRPSSYYGSLKAAIGTSAFIWLLFIGAIVATVRKNKKQSV